MEVEDDQNAGNTGLLTRLKNLVKRHKASKKSEPVHDKIVSLIERTIGNSSQIDSSVLRMIASVLEFNDKIVREVMVPRVEMVCVEAAAGVGELKRIMAEEGYSRIPVFEDNIDNIVGIAHVRDLIRQEIIHGREPFEIGKIMMKPFFVPETKKARDLLATFRTDKNLMAIAVDEYGGTAGLITIEDLLEEIVGEIRGEFEPELEEPIKVLDENTIVADGNTDLDLLQEHVKLSIEENPDFDTLAGFILDQIGSVPAEKESFDFDGLRFTVLEADERRILKVKIERLQPELSAEHDE
ncbi:MAG: magnesium/cobalt efflux protein [Candidatus Coatesbacteria bacterium]|nr:MAG: magnesium/cobalt efflux protein [Candidatus Coatesbacteria bacterium]